MNISLIGSGETIAYLKEDQCILKDSQSALDLMMSVVYETGLHKLIWHKTIFDESFFDLKTKLLGEVMQKAVNYKVQIAIIGDFNKETSKSLNDLRVECNRGRQFFMVNTLEEAIEKLK